VESVKDTASWAALIGAVLPILIAIVQQPRWSSQVRQVIAVGVAALGGVGTVLASGNFDAQNWLVTLVAVIGAAQASYALIFKPSGVAAKIEEKTSTDKGEDGAVSIDFIVGCLVGAVVLFLILLLGDNLNI
jgi:hypothetical protein